MALENVKQSSSSSTKKWLIGCGIGCGAIALIVIILVMGGFFFIRNVVQDFRSSEELMDTLVEEFGAIQEYCPSPNGAIEPERLEAFLAVREEGMGMGEYYYLYTVSYYSWLGKPILDGHDFQIRGDDEGYRFNDWEGEESDEVRQDMTLRWLHRIILPMLHNQYEKLTGGDVPGAQRQWQRALEAEMEAMESNRYRLVWQDGLPEVIGKSLEPFKQRLEASYSPLTNGMEIALERR